MTPRPRVVTQFEKKNICVFFFAKKLGLQKKTLKMCVFFFFFGIPTHLKEITS